MIFSPESVRQIQSGRKTMTRRPVKAGEKECRYREGHVYAVQPGRGRRAVCVITIKAVRQEFVGQISLEDARREGCRTTSEFFARWHRLYGPTDSPGVRVLVKTLADERREEGRAALMLSIEESREQRAARPPLQAIPTLVWVMLFERGDTRADVPRLLRSGAPTVTICKAVDPKTGKPCKAGIPAPEKPGDARYCPRCGHPVPIDLGDDHGYIRADLSHRGRGEEPARRPIGAMANEPEAVSEVYQEQISRIARAKPRVSEREVFIEERETILVAIAKIREHTDSREVNSDLRLMERRLAAIDRKLEMDAA